MSGSTSIVVQANNADIYYSPENWDVVAAGAVTVNNGAYFRFAFVGTSFDLDVYVPSTGTFPQIYVVIDGTSTFYNMANNTVVSGQSTKLNITPPAGTGSWGFHVVEVRIKAVSDNETVWAANPTSFFLLQQITIYGTSPAPAIMAPPVQPLSVVLFGDSITASFRSYGTTPTATGSDDVTNSDGTQGWAFRQKDLVGVEVGVIGFPGQYLTNAGTALGGAPGVTQTYGLVLPGVNRSFNPAPNLFVINFGTNDAQQASVTSAMIQASLVTLLDGLLAACPSTPIIVMQPFEGSGANMTPAGRALVTSGLQAGVAQVNSALVSYLSTTGWFNGAAGVSVDGTHPYGCANAETIAPLLAPVIRGILSPTKSASFHPMFK